MSAPLLLAVGLLGGAGALARFLVDGAISARARRAQDHDRRPFALGILVVNLSGAFLLGIVVGVAVHGDRYSLVATGLLGSYTTFSTWVFDSHRLARGGRGGAAALNLGASLALGLLAVWLGRELAGRF
jgi:CrcB protein